MKRQAALVPGAWVLPLAMLSATVVAASRAVQPQPDGWRWQHVVSAEDNVVQGRSADLRGRFRLSEAQR